MKRLFIYAIPYWVADSINVVSDVKDVFNDFNDDTLSHLKSKIDISDFRDLITSVAFTNNIIFNDNRYDSIFESLVNVTIDNSYLQSIDDIYTENIISGEYMKYLRTHLTGMSDSNYTLVNIPNRGIIIIMNKGFYSYVGSSIHNNKGLYKDILNELLKVASFSDVASTKMFNKYVRLRQCA